MTVMTFVTAAVLGVSIRFDGSQADHRQPQQAGALR
jgi:hypothetical protein